MSINTIDQLERMGVPNDIDVADCSDEESNQTKIKNMALKFVLADDGVRRFLLAGSEERLVIGMRIQDGRCYWVFANDDESAVKPNDVVIVLNEERRIA